MLRQIMVSGRDAAKMASIVLIRAGENSRNSTNTTILIKLFVEFSTQLFHTFAVFKFDGFQVN